MAETKLSLLTTRGTPDRAVDQIYVINGGAEYRSTLNNELGITGNPVGHTDVQTLTNKTLTAPTISSPVFSGTITGTYTLGGTPTFPSSVATLTGSQTLTNKVLTSPTINTPTITNATISSDAITGFSTANSGTIYGVPITSGALNGSSISQGTVAAAALSTSAITLGYNQVTASFSTASTTVISTSAPVVTVTIPSGGRRVKITAWCGVTYNSSATGYAELSIWDGAVVSGTQLAMGIMGGLVANGQVPQAVIAVVSPSAGSKTYTVGYRAVVTGTANFNAAATYPTFILVEAI